MTAISRPRARPRAKSGEPAPDGAVPPIPAGWGVEFSRLFECGPGHVAEVLGAAATVVDAERRVGLDHGALRFQPLARPGWGREAVAWGPFERRPGLAASILVLNGHNASADGPLGEPFRTRIRRWLDGPGGESPLRRAVGYARHPRRSTWQIRNWLMHSGRFHRPSGVTESLSFGWAASATAAPPGRESLLVQGSEDRNGALALGRAGTARVVVQDLRNLPLLLVALDRGETTAYYAASTVATHNLPAAALGVRPVGVVRNGRQRSAWASLQQAVLGQIGFRVDTRVYGVRTAAVPGWSGWYGSARFADRCTGEGGLAAAAPAIGGGWSVVAGVAVRTGEGVRAAGGPALALSDCDAPGFVRAVVAPGAGSAGLVIASTCARGQVQVVANGGTLTVTEIASGRERRLGEVACAPSPAVDLQVILEGRTLRVSANAASLECRSGIDLGGPAGVVLAGDAALRDFEVHPGLVSLPGDLAITGPAVPRGETTVGTDAFQGPARDLAGSQASAGRWSRTLGEGALRVSGGAAAVVATADRPNPGRTAFTLPWPNPELADVEVTITPPGRGRGEGHNGRGGVIFWQDADNYVIVNNWLDDGYPGASISSFFRLDGYEDIYEAVWTNVASRVRWGEPHVFRVAFDGLRYVVRVDDEPVLYRSLTDVRPEARRLAIRRVGIVANWEWGNDTGSRFERFVARA